MKFIFTSLLLIILSTSSFANENYYLIFGGWSYHTDDRNYKYDFEKYYNETHFTIGLEYEQVNKTHLLSFACLTFKNSFYNQSYTCNAGYKKSTKYGNFGLRVGVVSGYKEESYSKVTSRTERNARGRTIITTTTRTNKIPNINGNVMYIIPVYEIGYKNFKAEFSYIPSVSPGDGSNLSSFNLTLKYKLWPFDVTL